MIILDVADYCQNCDRFEPTAEITDLFAGGTVYHRETAVRCKHKTMCAGIYDSTIKRMKDSALNQIMGSGLPVVDVDKARDGSGITVKLDATKVNPDVLRRLYEEVDSAFRIGFNKEE